MRTILVPSLALLIALPAHAAPVRSHASSSGAFGSPVSVGAQDPAVSPDGSRIVGSILGKLWLVPIAGGDAVQMTEGPGWDSHPAWSPDGRFVAYAHALSSGTDLMIHNVATGTDASVYHTPARLGQISYHPMGKEIFFLLDRGQYDSHLWRVPTDGGEAKQITFTRNWHEWSFALSPDGREIFLESGRYGGADLYLISADSSADVKRITNTPAANEFSVAWSRDGKTRAFIVEENGVDSVMVQPADGSRPPHRIFTSEYDQKQLTLDPTGRFAVMCAGRKLYRLDLASGAITPIPFTAQIANHSQAAADMIITHANVWPGGSHVAIPDGTVEIRAGRIVSVHAGAPSRVAVGTTVIDAQGKTVIPGLMDNHYHFWDIFQGSGLISHGVTTIRDPGAAVSMSTNLRDAIRDGLDLGPTIYTAGPLIDGVGGYHPYVDVELSSPAAAAPLVRSLKAQGVDLLKVYFLLEPSVLKAVVDEAHKQGLKVTGHIGVHTGWGEAMSDGIDGLNHIRVWRDILPPELQPSGANESLDAEKAEVPRMQADWRLVDPDGPQAGALINQMVAGHVGFDPTLHIQHIDPSQRSGLSLEQYAVARDSYTRMGRFVARAAKAGVLLLAGTDDEGSLFDEMEAYADVGIPPLDVLRAATVNGALWLGKEAEFGTLEPGRRADLVIVDGNPLVNIKDVRKVSVVVKNGVVVFEK